MGKGAEQDARAAAKTQQTEQTARINEDRAKQDANLQMWKDALNKKLAQTDYRTPEQMKDVIGSASTIASGTGKSVEDTARRFQLRTGTNSANIGASLAEAARERERQLNTNVTAQKVQDQDKLAGEKMQALTMLGDPAKLYAQNYGTSTTGLGNANDLQGKAAMANNSPWGSILGLAGNVAMAAGTGVACWIAEALYGADDPRTHILRYWLNKVFGKTPAGAVVMAAYVKYGVAVAKLVRRWKVVRGVFRPLFDHALARAIEHAEQNILLPRAA